MKELHRIELTAHDVRTALQEYLLKRCKGLVPSATIRCKTQSPIEGEKDRPDLILIEIEWGG